MASLLPSDQVLPAPVSDVISAIITSRSAFASSAAAGMDLDAGARMGGNFYSRGRWNLDAVASEKIDGSASTPGKITDYADIAPVCRRKRSRGIVDGVDAAMGAAISISPTQALLEQSGAYWGKEIDNSLVSALKAFFDASSGPLLATHCNPVATTTGAVVPASFGNLVDTATLLGDNLTDLAVMVCHAKVWANLRKEAGAKVTYNPIGSAMVPYYDGLRVLLSDAVPTSGSSTYKKYWTILLRPGALFVALQQAMREIIEINATVPETRITQTLHYAPGATGMKWNVTDANPADSLIDDYGSWAKATSVDKEIGMVALISNAN